MPTISNLDEFKALEQVGSEVEGVQEGDLDHMRALIEAFLAVAERVLPEQFLVTVSGQPVSANQPGSFFS